MLPNVHSAIRYLSWAFIVGNGLFACSDGETNSSQTQADHALAATGGASSSSGGATSTGGNGLATGGTSLQSSTTANTGGAAVSTGGAPTGGAPTGGASAIAGAPSTGGSQAAGGATSVTGGSPATGGKSATGGTTASNTTSTTGGCNCTGGASSSGGSNATGGVKSTTGGAVGTGGSTSSTACPLLYDFEPDMSATGNPLLGWYTTMGNALSASSKEAISGTNSLQVTVPSIAEGSSIQVSVVPTKAANLWPGSLLTLNVKVPNNAKGLGLQAFVQSQNWTQFQTSGNAMVAAIPGDWTTWSFTIPDTLPGGIQALGIEISVGSGGHFSGGDIFIDSITSCTGPEVCAGVGEADYGWETAGALSGWKVDGNSAVPEVAMEQSSDLALEGAGSLKVTFANLPANAKRRIQLDNPNAYCGQEITFNVYATADFDPGITVQPFANVDNWVWNAGTIATLTPGAWNRIKYTLPLISSLGLQNIGLQLNAPATAAAPYSGGLYIDEVSWGSK